VGCDGKRKKEKKGKIGEGGSKSRDFSTRTCALRDNTDARWERTEKKGGVSGKKFREIYGIRSKKDQRVIGVRGLPTDEWQEE